MNIDISIACLIFKSTKWLKFVYDQVNKYTNLQNKEFYFVANDATEEVLNYLKEHNIPHYIHNNSEEQKKEWYINNVYRAWNTAAKMAKGKYVVFINSDMAFSPNWLDNLLDKIDDNKCITSRLVERGILRSGTYGIEINFGNNPSDYRENDFTNYVNTIKDNKLHNSGLYMPMLIKKQNLEDVNFFPEGNVKVGSDIFNPVYAKIGDNLISGDKIFIEKLKTIGVEHYTSFNSIVYHFQEGETREI